MDAVIGNYGDWFQVPKVTGRCSSPVLSVFDGYVKISMKERNGFFPSRFQGSQTLGAHGKAVCFNRKHVTKEAVPYRVSGKQRERKEKYGHFPLGSIAWLQ